MFPAQSGCPKASREAVVNACSFMSSPTVEALMRDAFPRANTLP